MENEPPTEHVRLRDLYDADQRRTCATVASLAAAVRIPHPLRGVRYADGIKPCTHAHRHQPGTCA